VAESKTEPAVVFKDESHSGTDVVHFGGYPGVFVPGEKVAVSELEFDTAKEATDQADELGLPLEKTTVAVGKGKMVARDNRAASDADVRSVPVAEAETVPPTTEPEKSDGGEG
jgi:hypothetical protein